MTDTFDAVGRRIVGTITKAEHDRQVDEVPVVHFVVHEPSGWADE